MKISEAIKIVREEAAFCRRLADEDERDVDEDLAAFCGHKAESQETVVAEVERLQAIVGKLPKTADGVIIVPMLEDDQTLYAIDNGEIYTLDVYRMFWTGESWWVETENLEGPISECFYNSEAAEAGKVS
jgi:hypothetical protein